MARKQPWDFVFPQVQLVAMPICFRLMEGGKARVHQGKSPKVLVIK